MPWKTKVWQDEYQALCHIKDMSKAVTLYKLNTAPIS